MLKRIRRNKSSDMRQLNTQICNNMALNFPTEVIEPRFFVLFSCAAACLIFVQLCPVLTRLQLSTFLTIYIQNKTVCLSLLSHSFFFCTAAFFSFHSLIFRKTIRNKGIHRNYVQTLIFWLILAAPCGQKGTNH